MIAVAGQCWLLAPRAAGAAEPAPSPVDAGAVPASPVQAEGAPSPVQAGAAAPVEAEAAPSTVQAGAAPAPGPEIGGPPASQPAEEALPRRDWFHLNIADLYVGFATDWEFRRVHTAPTPTYRLFWPAVPYSNIKTTQENRDLRLDETVGISLRGDIVDPGLLEYRADLEFGLEQTRDHESLLGWHASDQGFGFMQHYDISIDALKCKPVSIHAYARRIEDRVPRRFLPSLHEIQTEAGVSALALTGPVTTEIGYSYRDVDQYGNRLQEDNESLTLNRFYLDSRWQIAEQHSLHVTWDHQREEDTYQGSAYRFKTSIDEFRIDHELAFGDSKQHRLDSYLRYDNETGDYGRDEFEFVPRLTLQHTDNFKTIYRYAFYRVGDPNIDLYQHKFDVEAIWQATRDLRLGADVFALTEHVENDANTQEYGLSGDATYHRETSLGDLYADLNLAYDGTRVSGSGGRRYVRNEAHTLGGVRPVILRNREVILATIIARSADYSRIFIPGLDYTVIPIGHFVMIKRSPFGRIAEDEVVYFSYEYRVPVGAQVDAYRVDLRLEHAFTCGLTPYYYWESRFENVDHNSIGTLLERDNQDRHRLGLRYGRERWNVTGEYEIYDDSVEPYDAWHITGQASVFRSPRNSLDVTGEVSRWFFRGGVDRRLVWYMDLDVKNRMEITDFLSLTAGTELRHQDDNIQGNTDGVDIDLGLKYVRGYLTVELDLEYDLLSIVKNREEGFAIFLNVKRDLAHLLPGRGEEDMP